MITENNRLSAKQIQRANTLTSIVTPILLAPYICIRSGKPIVTLVMGMVLIIIYGAYLAALSSGKKAAGVTENGAITILNVLQFLRYSIKNGLLLWYSAIAIKKYLMYDMNEIVILILLGLVAGYSGFREREKYGRTMEFFYYWVIIPLVLVGVLGVIKGGEHFAEFAVSEITSTSVSDINFYQVGWFALLLLSISTSHENSIYQGTSKNGRSSSFIYSAVTLAGLVLFSFIVITGILGFHYPGKSITNSLGVMESVGIKLSSLNRVDYLVFMFLVIGLYAMISGIFHIQHELIYMNAESEGSCKSEIVRRNTLSVIGMVIAICIGSWLVIIGNSEDSIAGIIGKYLIYFELPMAILMPCLYTFVRQIRSRKRIASVLLGFVACISLLSLTGCAGNERSSVEDLDFVNEIDILFLPELTSESSRYIFAFRIPDLEVYGGKPGDKVEYKTRNVIGTSLMDAEEEYEKLYGKGVFLGHLKTIKINCYYTEDSIDSILYELCNEPTISNSTECTFCDGTVVTLLEIIKIE